VTDDSAERLTPEGSGTTTYKKVADRVIINFDICLSRAETELTKNGVSGTRIDQAKSILKIGNIVVSPICAVNIPKVG
jgi:hypothetical protein